VSFLIGWFRFRIAAAMQQPNGLHVFYPVFAGRSAETPFFPDAFAGCSL
jgi:hypothetical protein